MKSIITEYKQLNFWATYYLIFFWKGVKKIIRLRNQGVKLSVAEMKQILHWCSYRRHKEIVRKVHEAVRQLSEMGHYDHLEHTIIE